MSHAILSPSGASRWLSCTPSARMEQKFPDKAGQAAEEGTLAHSLGELLIRYKLSFITDLQFTVILESIKAHKLYDGAMLDHMDNYATFVIEQLNEALSHTADAAIFLEQKIDLTKYVPEGFGTGDVVIIANHVLNITDLKYGKGVPVSADNNKQLMLYGLGALEEFEHLYDITLVRLTIYQPRLDSISVWEISVEELKQWAETELTPKAALAFKGEGEFIAGKHCGFCRAKAVCKANAQMNLELAKYEFLDSFLLDGEEISDILTRADNFITWVNSVKRHALVEAIQGKKWPGYKLVEGRSTRKFSDEEEVKAKLLDENYALKVITKSSLLGITDLTKLMGKKEFDAVLGDLIIKPAGAPTLVPASDKRAEYNSADAAKADFADVEFIDD